MLSSKASNNMAMLFLHLCLVFVILLDGVHVSWCALPFAGYVSTAKSDKSGKERRLHYDEMIACSGSAIPERDGLEYLQSMYCYKTGYQERADEYAIGYKNGSSRH